MQERMKFPPLSSFPSSFLSFESNERREEREEERRGKKGTGIRVERKDKDDERREGGWKTFSLPSLFLRDKSQRLKNLQIKMKSPFRMGE
jgi:hypothetical protein